MEVKAFLWIVDSTQLTNIDKRENIEEKRKEGMKTSNYYIAGNGSFNSLNGS